MQSVPLLDRAGRRRSRATLASFHAGRSPRNKGLRYPPDPPTVEEIIAVMCAAGEDPDGLRLRGLIVVLWRAGLRISETLALVETDLDQPRGAILVRSGKGQAARGRDGSLGLEATRPVARAPRDSASRRAVLHSAWPDTRTTMRIGGPASAAAQHRPGSRGAPPVRAPSPSARARRRDVPRRSSAPSHPAPTRACRPRDHIRRTYAGSTTPRSSKPSTNDPHP